MRPEILFGRWIPPSRKAFARCEFRLLVDLADPVFRQPLFQLQRSGKRWRRAPIGSISRQRDLKATDVEGSAFIDTASYMIRKAVFRLTKPDKLTPPVIGLEVTTLYREISNGLALFEEIHSEQALSNRFRSSQLQDQKLSRSSSTVARLKTSSSRTRDPFVPQCPGFDGAHRRNRRRFHRQKTSRRGEILCRHFVWKRPHDDERLRPVSIRGIEAGQDRVLVRAFGFGPATFTTDSAPDARVRCASSSVRQRSSSAPSPFSTASALRSRGDWILRAKNQGMGIVSSHPRKLSAAIQM